MMLLCTCSDNRGSRPAWLAAYPGLGQEAVNRLSGHCQEAARGSTFAFGVAAVLCHSSGMVFRTAIYNAS